ncbi:MAG: hypothetical protein HYR85_18615 [Planctomycetes bacterium]|nr:hypothetical protein [Planctomycetota bacterium]
MASEMGASPERTRTAAANFRAHRASPGIAFIEWTLTLVWLAWVLATYSNVEADELPGVPLILIGGALLLGIPWLVRAMMLFGRARGTAADTPRSRRPLVRCLAFPIALTIGVFAKTTYFPFRIRFAASEAALERAVAGVAPGTSETYPDDRQIGLFWVWNLESDDRCVRLVTGRAFLGVCGLAYAPKGKPPESRDDDYWHVEGPWWGWYRYTFND